MKLEEKIEELEDDLLEDDLAFICALLPESCARGMKFDKWKSISFQNYPRKYLNEYSDAILSYLDNKYNGGFSTQDESLDGSSDGRVAGHDHDWIYHCGCCVGDIIHGHSYSGPGSISIYLDDKFFCREEIEEVVKKVNPKISLNPKKS